MIKKILLYVVIVIVLICLIPFVYNQYVKVHRQFIDYSCETDSDCAIKFIRLGICDSAVYRCTNVDSVEGKTPFMLMREICTGIEIRPDECKCENQKCMSYVKTHLMKN